MGFLVEPFSIPHVCGVNLALFLAKVSITGSSPRVWGLFLADLIIIQDYLFGEPTRAQEVPQMPMQSYSAPHMEQVEIYVETNGDSEFLKAVDGRKAERVWKLIDELVEAGKILHPRMYTTFIDKVQDL